MAQKQTRTREGGPRGGQYAGSVQRAFEELARAEGTVEALQMWVSYLHAMRHQVLSPLLWGKLEKFMQDNNLELLDLSFEDLP